MDRMMEQNGGRQFVDMLEQFEDGIVGVDGQWRIVWVNRAASALLSHNRQALHGQPLWHFMPEQVKNMVAPKLRQALATGKPVRIESRAPDGEHWCEFRAYPWGDGLTIWWRDITEGKKNEQALLETRDAAASANRIKSEFLANMSHEIRTPMTVIMAAMEQIQEAPNSADNRQYLEMAQTSGETLLRIIDDILDFARLEAGELQLEQAPFAMRETISTLVDDYAREAQRKGLRMELQIDPQIPEVFTGDARRLRQIMANLIGNAIKFTERGSITISATLLKGASAGADALHIAIRDTGIGIPEEKKKLLFLSFSQADSSITRRYGGTGLGLALSKHLVQRMGGRIGMESETGQGSVFSFSIPIPANNRPLAQPAPNRPTTKQRPPLDILLVEDDPAIREMIRMILTERHWQVTTASDGNEALTLWRKQPFDIILMDLQMPGLDGLETTRIIRQQEGDRHTPIIALTAYARKEDERASLGAGMDGYLSKPVKLDQLYALIETHTDHTNSEA